MDIYPVKKKVAWWGLKSILSGWWKRYFSKPTDESKRRLSICKTCKFAKPNKILKILNGSENWEDSLQCTICHCPCLEKSLVESESCPKSKW